MTQSFKATDKKHVTGLEPACLHHLYFLRRISTRIGNTSKKLTLEGTASIGKTNLRVAAGKGLSSSYYHLKP